MSSEFEGWFKKELERRGLPVEPPADPRTTPTPDEASKLTESASATVHITRSGYFPATIRISAKADKILKVASGLISGKEDGGISAFGTLKFISWETLMEKWNTVFVSANGRQLTIVFSIDDKVVAIFEGRGAGNLQSGHRGWVEWKDTLDSE